MKHPIQGRLPLLLATAATLICSHAAEPTPDFSKGLDMLAKLALPEMKGAQWVPNKERESYNQLSHTMQEMKIEIKGGYWKLDNPPRKMGIATSQTEPLDEKNTDNNEAIEEGGGKFSLLRNMVRNYSEKNGIAEKPKDAEDKPNAEDKPKVPLIRADCLRIIKGISEPEAAASLNNGMRWQEQSTAGILLLFAAQVHHSGDTQSANELAAALFNAIDDDQKMIDHAINQLADEEYLKLIGEFTEKQDWNSYLEGIRKLIAKYPRGWNKTQALAILAARISERGKVKWQPKIEGVNLNPKAIALMDQLLEKPKANTISDEKLLEDSGYSLDEIPAHVRPQFIANLRRQHSNSLDLDSYSLWTLPDTGNEEDTTEEDAANPSPVTALKALGMDAVIALAAYVEDETLTYYPRSNDGGHFGYGSEEIDPLTRYNSLSRPISRGEIASQLLASVIPINDDSSGEAYNDDEALKQLAIDFWKKHRQSPPHLVAAEYINSGNSSQNELAAAKLIALNTPEADQIFEKTILAAEEPLRLTSLVETYLKERKAKAKPFAQAFIALLRELPTDKEALDQIRYSYNVTQSGSIEGYIKKLSVLVGDISLDKLILSTLKEKKDPDAETDAPSPILSLQENLNDKSNEEIMAAFGKVADKATPEQWLEIHELLINHIGRNAYQMEDIPTPTDASDTTKNNLSPATIELWKKHRSRQDPITENPDTPWVSGTRSIGASTVGDLSTLLMDYTMDPSSIMGQTQLQQITDDHSGLMKRIQQRVDDRIAGKTPQAWPDAGKVNEERLKAIGEEIRKLPQADIIPWAKKLNEDERAALSNLIIDWIQNQETPENLSALRGTIVSIPPQESQNHDAKFIETLGIKAGDPITVELLNRISDTMLRDPEISGGSLVMIRPATMMLGSTIYAVTPRNTKVDEHRQMYLRSIAYQLQQQHTDLEIISCIQLAGQRYLRTLKDGKTEEVASGSEQGKTLDEAFEAMKKLNINIIISVLNSKEAETIINQN